MSETIEPLASPATSVPWTPMWPLSPTVPTTVPQAHVYRSTPQNIAHGTVAPLSFDVELYDTDAIHDAVNPTRLTCKTAGTYLIWVVLGWASNATGERQALVYQNGGSTEIGSANQLAVGGNFTKLSFPVIRQLAVGDYVEVNAYQNSGVALDASRAEFAMTMLSPALLPAPGALIPVTYGTSLPASPADGQEAILVDSLTAPTYQWRFRYNAGSSSAYKWEFVGGTPFTMGIGANEVLTPTITWSDLGTVGPSFVLPRTGDYDFEFGGNTYHPSAVWADEMGIAVGAGTPWLSGSANGSGGSAQNLMVTGTNNGNAGQEWRVRYRTYYAGVNYNSRILRVWPRRVS